MTAKDVFHEAVKRGLEKDQWIITDDPLELQLEQVTVKIDVYEPIREEIVEWIS